MEFHVIIVRWFLNELLLHHHLCLCEISHLETHSFSRFQQRPQVLKKVFAEQLDGSSVWRPAWAQSFHLLGESHGILIAYWKDVLKFEIQYFGGKGGKGII